MTPQVGALVEFGAVFILVMALAAGIHTSRSAERTRNEILQEAGRDRGRSVRRLGAFSKGSTAVAGDTHDHRGWTKHWAIVTLEGAMHASPGDWIITGVKGERYPCKPDIFAATYEAVGMKHLRLAAVLATPLLIWSLSIAQARLAPGQEPGPYHKWFESQVIPQGDPAAGQVAAQNQTAISSMRKTGGSPRDTTSFISTANGTTCPTRAFCRTRAIRRAIR